MKQKESISKQYSDKLLKRLDRRTSIVKALQAREESLMNDLGGKEYLSHQQIGLCKRSVYLEALCEGIESDLMLGKNIDRSEYVLISNALRLLYTTLGLQRQAKELRLRDYVREKYETDTD